MATLEIILICLSFYLWITTIVATYKNVSLMSPNAGKSGKVIISALSPVLFPLLYIYVILTPNKTCQNLNQK